MLRERLCMPLRGKLSNIAFQWVMPPLPMVVPSPCTIHLTTPPWLVQRHGCYSGGTRLYQCKDLKCEKNPDGEYGICCCRQVLFNEPDFVNVPSLLSMLCHNNGVKAIFLPKFSPELNPIEQCWGYAKWKYRETPPSSSIDDLVKNALNSLDSVPLESICRSVNEAFLSLTLPDVFQISE